MEKRVQVYQKMKTKMRMKKMRRMKMKTRPETSYRLILNSHLTYSSLTLIILIMLFYVSSIFIPSIQELWVTRHKSYGEISRDTLFSYFHIAVVSNASTLLDIGQHHSNYFMCIQEIIRRCCMMGLDII